MDSTTVRTDAPRQGATGRSAVEADALPARVGRYRILRLLGAGGMGTVYVARDPALDRDVALKLVRVAAGVDPRARTRLIREARAMAQLSDPHVIPVFDVGCAGDEVYIAMELVDGVELSEWFRQRPSWSVMRDALVQAGEGLAAAHEAGLIHRDFKPANVIAGADGRIRVLDFGLARALSSTSGCSEPLESSVESQRLEVELTAAGTVMGTPAYMAPEQHRGGIVDERTDQYAFCVTAYEGLYGRRPFAGGGLRELLDAKLAGGSSLQAEGATGVPAWLHRVIARGLAADPAERWPSMRALLAAMGGRRRRRETIVVGLAALGMLGAFSVTRADPSDACRHAGPELQVAWNEARKAEIGRAFVETGVAQAAETWDRAKDELETYAGTWLEQRTSTCEAIGEADRDDTRLDRRMHCLDLALTELQTLTDAFTVADAQTVHHALPAVRGLQARGECDAVGAAPIDPEIRTRVETAMGQVAQARVLAELGRPQEALARLEAIDEAALRYRPLAIEAGVARGRFRGAVGGLDAARSDLSDAYLAAVEEGDDESALRATAEMLFVLAEQEAGLELAETWWRHGEAAAARWGREDATTLHVEANWAAALVRHMKTEEGVAAYREVLAKARRILPPEHPQVLYAVLNLGTALTRTGELDEAIELLRESIDLVESSSGPWHPEAGKAHQNLGTALFHAGQLEPARSELLRAEAIFLGSQIPSEHTLTGVYNNLAGVSYEQGKYEEALDYLGRTRKLLAAGDAAGRGTALRMMSNEALVLRKLGRAEEARDLLRMEIDEARAMFGPEHVYIVEALIDIGDIELELGRPAEARAPLEEALALLDKTESRPSYVARGKFSLARALWPDGGEPVDRSRAIELARAVRDMYDDDDRDDLYAEAVAWLESHDPDRAGSGGGEEHSTSSAAAATPPPPETPP